jgi:hypothetical protein
LSLAHLLAGTDNIGMEAIGAPLVAIDQFIVANRSKFVLDYTATMA